MEKPRPDQTWYIDIKLQTLLKIVLFFLFIYVLFISKTVLLMLYVSLILAATFRPIVNYAKILLIPETLAILLIYLSIILFFTLGIMIVIPPITTEISDFVNNLDATINDLSVEYEFIAEARENLDIDALLSTLQESWQQISTGVLNNAWSLAGGFLSVAISVFLVLMLTFYLLIEESSIQNQLSSLAPENRRKDVRQLIRAVQLKLGAWARGQLSLMVIIGLLSYAFFLLLDIKYAVPLALIAGFLEIIPYVGPVIAGFIAAIVTLPTSSVQALLVMGVAVIIQQIENSIIVPIVMKQAVGLNPIVVLISLMVGERTFGSVGAVLAVPMVATIQIFIEYYWQYKKEDQIVTAEDDLSFSILGYKSSTNTNVHLENKESNSVVGISSFKMYATKLVYYSKMLLGFFYKKFFRKP